MSSLGLRKAEEPSTQTSLALQRPLEPLQDAEFVVVAIDLGFTVDLFEDLLLPGRSDHALDRDRLREVPAVAAQMAPDDGEGLDDGLKPIVAAELQAFEQGRQHAPVVACELPLHDGLPEQAQARSADVKLGHQVPEGFLLDAREDHLAYDAVGVLHHGLGDVGQNLHLALDPLEILEPLPVDLLLRARAQALDEFDGHPRHVVGHLVGALVEKAPHEGMANVVGVRAHFAGFLVGRAPFERLEHLRRNSGEGLGAEADGSDRSQPVEFGLEVLDARLAGVVLQRFEPRGATLGRDDQQIVHAAADLGGDGLGNPPVDVVEEPAQGRVDDALQLCFDGQFDTEASQSPAGTIEEAFSLLNLPRGLLAQPAFEVVLVLGGGETPTRVPPDREEVQLPRPAVPPVLLGEVPEQAQLPHDERANLVRNAVQTVGDVAEVSQRLQ